MSLAARVWIGAVAWLLPAAGAMAQETRPAADPPALRGLDPVELIEGHEAAGKDQFTATHGRYTYRFCSSSTRDRFLATPDRYAIRWGGACARMGPLSGRGDPDRYAVWDRCIFLFASDGCRDGFLRAPERFVPPGSEVPQPPPPPGVFVASFEHLQPESGDARPWIERAVATHGGAAAIDGPAGMLWRHESSTQGWKNRVEQIVDRSGHILRHTEWIPPSPADGAATETTWVVATERFVREDNAMHGLSGPEIAAVRRFALRDPITLLRLRKHPHFRARSFAGAFDGKPCARIEVDFGPRGEAETVTLILDAESAEILGLEWHGRPLSGLHQFVVERFTKWRSLDGVRIPASRKVTVDGQPAPRLVRPWDRVEWLKTRPDQRLAAPKWR